MQNKQLTYKILILSLLILGLAAAWSCQEEEPPRNGDALFRLSSSIVPMEGDENPESKAFADATTYALFAVVSPAGGSRDWRNPVLAVSGTEANGHITYSGANSFMERTLDFFGMTLGDESPVYDNIMYDRMSGQSPKYHLKGVMRSSGRGTFYDFPDMRWGSVLGRNAENSSFLIEMPFKHSLSKLIIEASRQNVAQMEGVQITHIDFDSYSEGMLDLETGTVTASGTRQNILLYDNTNNNPVDVDPIKLVQERFVLPYRPADNNNQALRIRVHTNRPSIGNNGVVDCELVMTAPDGTRTPLELKSNVIYTIRLTVTTDEVRVVTIIPQYYDWIDDYLETVDMGTPVSFNGVLWCDRNLGASSANPTASIEEWNKSVGYFYQFGRNIPFFPNTFRNGSTDLETQLNTALQNGRNVYPAVNLTTWDNPGYDIVWEPAPWDEQWDGWFQRAQDPEHIVWQMGEFPTGGNARNDRLLGFYNQKSNIPNAATHWNTQSTQPCPAGWRLPTQDDWLGIMPYSPIAGNIALRVFDKADESWQTPDATRYSEPNFAEDYKDIVILSGAFSPYPASMHGTPAYTGDFPLLQRTETNCDPSPGRSTTYVISFDGDDWNKYTCTNGAVTPNDGTYTYNWGVVYALKNQGTNEAYRLRWRIVLVGSEAEQARNPRAVLVIERYPASVQDRLSRDNVKTAFDWSHPVERMYLPISGLVSASWNPGTIINIGGEVAYASSGEKGGNLNYGSWFKVIGDNTTNMQISAVGSEIGLGMQVRCVRDLDF